MAGSSTPSASIQPRVAGISIQTAGYGGTIAIVYGTNRVAANLIWYRNFKATPIYTGHQGGKGGASRFQIGYTYTAAVILALCEGPIGNVHKVWRDKDILALSNLGGTLIVGNRTQSPWSYVTTNFPSEAIGYAGT